jgi:hypothetical protein
MSAFGGEAPLVFDQKAPLTGGGRAGHRQIGRRKTRLNVRKAIVKVEPNREIVNCRVTRLGARWS